MAASAAPAKVPVSLEFTVNGTGREGERIYLNSEADYRDQRAVTVVVLASAIGDLRARLGPDIERALRGKPIAVTGEAQRVTIWFLCNGVQTDKYYFQTHIVVRSAEQLLLVGGAGA